MAKRVILTTTQKFDEALQFLRWLQQNYEQWEEPERNCMGYEALQELMARIDPKKAKKGGIDE